MQFKIAEKIIAITVMKMQNIFHWLRINFEMFRNVGMKISNEYKPLIIIHNGNDNDKWLSGTTIGNIENLPEYVIYRKKKN